MRKVCRNCQTPINWGYCCQDCLCAFGAGVVAMSLAVLIRLVLLLVLVVSSACVPSTRTPVPPPKLPDRIVVRAVAVVVKDSYGRPLPGAMCNLDGGPDDGMESNADGYALFAVVPASLRDTQLTCAKDGYESASEHRALLTNDNEDLAPIVMRSLHADPWALNDIAVRTYRGSIATVQMNLPYGPRPNRDNNVLFTGMYPSYGAEDRAKMRAAYKARGYTHWALGPLNAGSYHGDYPPLDFRSNPDAFLDLVQELYDDGFIPAIALVPPEGDRGYNVNDKLDWDAIERDLTPIYSSPRFQKLARLVFFAWEPNPVVDTSAEWLRAVQWMARVFPGAIRAIHFTAGHGAPCNGSDLRRGMTEATCWAAVAPYLHQFFAQDASMFGWYVDPKRTPWEQWTYNVMDGCRRFSTGYGGFPRSSAAPGRPIDWVWFEFGAYGVYNGWNTEADAKKYGDVVLATQGCTGVGDGFTQRTSPIGFLDRGSATGEPQRFKVGNASRSSSHGGVTRALHAPAEWSAAGRDFEFHIRTRQRVSVDAVGVLLVADPPLVRGVDHVVFSGTEKQVVWPDAQSDVASVADFSILRNRSERQLPGHAVGEFHTHSSPSGPDHSVACSCWRAGPEPTTSGLVDLLPETICERTPRFVPGCVGAARWRPAAASARVFQVGHDLNYSRGSASWRRPR